MVYAARRTMFGGPPPAVPGVMVRVGSFAKTTAAATAAQPVIFGSKPGYEVRPVALVLWTSGGTVDGTIRTQAAGDARACIGFASGTAAAQQYAAAAMADTAGQGGRRTTQKAFLLCDTLGALSSEASLASFDADGFTLSWTTNVVGESQIIHYFAIGGADVQAKVIRYTSPAGTGNFATTGAGFVPNLILTTGTISALDTGGQRPFLRIGAAISSSSRWAVNYASWQELSQPSYRSHRNDRCVFQLFNDGTTASEMDHVSMEADGFTLNQLIAGTSSAGALCLRVPKVALGTFTKPTGGGPVVTTVTGLTRPAGVLLVSDQDINRANAASQTGSRLGISAFALPIGPVVESSIAGMESSVFSIPNAPNPNAFACLEKSSKAAVKIDNGTPAIDAESTAIIDSDRFTMTWNANDAFATEYSYVAIGAA